MKNRIKIIALLGVLFSGISIYAFEPVFGWPTKDYLGLSYSQGFNLENNEAATAGIITGAFKYDRTMFFRNHKVGFGFTMELGGPFYFTVRNRENRRITNVPAVKLDVGFTMFNGLGVAFDIPFNEYVNFYSIVGPCFDIWRIKSNDLRVFRFQFGAWGSFGVRFMPNKVAQFIMGVDISYKFLQAGYQKSNEIKNSMDPIASNFAIKPYIGVSFNMEPAYEKFRRIINKF